MGKYEESVYGRSEKKFKSVEEQIGWLSSFADRAGNEYEQDAVKVAEDLQKGLEISQEANETRSLRELGKLSTKANSLVFRKDEPLGTINERIRILEGEANELADIIRSSRDFLEINKAIEDLRELNPKKLGGIKSGQTRFKGSKKEQKLIAESLGFVFEE